jgi:glycosyltransferase involved in cell wall biosynthesis
MAVYNGQVFLRDTLNSLLAQTLHSFELIIVDDASTDETAAILEVYAKNDERFVLLRNEQNLGLPGALNRGLAVCRAPLVARADADDVYVPDRLERQVDYMRAHSEVGVAASRVEFIDDAGHFLRRREEVFTENQHIRFHLLFGNCLWHTVVMFRPDLVRSVGGYDERFTAGPEDYDLWARLIDKTCFGCLAHPLGKVRLHSSSMMAGWGEEGFRKFCSVSGRLLSGYLDRQLREDEVINLVTLYGWDRRMDKSSISVALDLLHEIRGRSRTKETSDTIESFEKKIAHSLITQSRIQTYTDRLLSVRLFLEAVKWSHHPAISRQSSKQVVRWLTPNHIRTKYKRAREWMKSQVESNTKGL